jgi:uncharacterized repeat protein (TIGR03803 family)
MSKLNWVTKACGVFLFWATAALALPAQTFTTLADFDGTDGLEPGYVSLVQALDGNFYGTTLYGGAHVTGGYGGTVFKVTPTGTLTTIYSFCALTNCADGNGPEAGLTLGRDGTFYGTTSLGGTSANCDFGCGTVFKITQDGILTSLYSFTDNENGFSPRSSLIQGNNGNFYGTTTGTIFEITPGGSLKTVHVFSDRIGGSFPYGGLIQAANGNLYGTTSSGGANGYGTVYQLTPGGIFTKLYDFCSLSGCADGSCPFAGLAQGIDGNLYGTTETGGLGTGPTCFLGGCGTVFKITLQGDLTTLHSFDGSDGAYIFGPVFQATDGNFYGGADDGGNTLCYLDEGCGTIYEITPTGTLTTLQIFDSTDGAYPGGGLVQDTSGKLYGTTSLGGTDDDGTVFSINEGLRPFVKSLPSYGAVGAKIGILGSNLTGATSVTFNGTPAMFTVKSKALITTTVPLGATTGIIQVTTPNATLTSNVAFTVQP